ncbi:MAG: UDP-N-acetylglucosamine 2-epimerase (non-hydrolyzing) [Candidatus Aminicenantes bacterium]|nr:UDP-N-acetylglucosamine 2-epimerase (non-hydrolyzing) [Candidatus Aminicenantes bacterium]
MKLVSVVGTRPNFIKEVLINRRLKALGVHEVLVHTGQHYDQAMSTDFFDQLEIPTPDYLFKVPTDSAAKQTAVILIKVEDILLKEKPDVTLVYGDVTSTLAGALASARLRIPVAHVEAGIRTEARHNPEEINRRLTDHLSSLLMTNTEDATAALLKEGFSPSDVVQTGDVMQDILMQTIDRMKLQIRRGDYHLATVHRAENVDDPVRLKEIVEGFINSGERILFPVHPRTKKRLVEFGLMERLKKSGNVKILPPLGYKEFVPLLAEADKVLTDSGGVRREAYILGKPVIVLIEITWFPAIADCGWKKIAGANRAAIVDAIRNFVPPAEHPSLFGDGLAHEHIVDAIISRFS